MIDNVIGDLVAVCCVAYMKDVLVLSKDREQHKKDIDEVLAALLVSDLRMKPSKCGFYREEIFFLGNLVLKDGLGILPDKSNAISKFDTLRNKT